MATGNIMVGSITCFFLEIYFPFQQLLKNFENLLRIDIVMSLVYYFFGTQCINSALQWRTLLNHNEHTYTSKSVGLKFHCCFSENTVRNVNI